uniref:Uncharacterized protein n=1 Tax=Arundo donax TaxID=35708 RepID=A0A0A9FPF6_ARUDO
MIIRAWTLEWRLHRKSI